RTAASAGSSWNSAPASFVRPSRPSRPDPARKRRPMRFNPEEITSVLKREIESYRAELDVAEVGTILEVGDGIARIYGLDRAMAGEMLEFDGGVRGQVFNLEEGSIGAIILGEYKDLKEGQTV